MWCKIVGMVLKARDRKDLKMINIYIYIKYKDVKIKYGYVLLNHTRGNEKIEESKVKM